MNPQNQNQQGQLPPEYDNRVVVGASVPTTVSWWTKLRAIVWPVSAGLARRAATIGVAVLLLGAGGFLAFALVANNDNVAVDPESGENGGVGQDDDRTFTDKRQSNGAGSDEPSTPTTPGGGSSGSGEVGSNGGGNGGGNGNGGHDGGSTPSWGLDFPANPTHQLSSIEYYAAITYNFDGEYTAGQYANGDWWVVGPVTLTGISPASTSVDHGENINPGVQEKNYRACIGTPVEQLGFPATVNPGSSIVKTTSRFGGPDPDGCWKSSGGHRGNLQTAAVLTVVDTPPPKNGATAFRPPYFGTNKRQYLTTDLRTDLLPQLAPPAGSFTSLAEVANKFSRVQIGHENRTEESRWIAPVDNRRDYGGDYAQDTYYAPVRLMMSDPLADKSQALINYVQFGIDLANMVEQEATACQGASNPSCAGHGPGRALPLVFAATMLDSGQDLKDIVVAKQNKLQSNWMTFYANAPAQVALYGETNCSETLYLDKLESSSNPGSATCKDPWGYIDGGGPFGSYLGCCVVSSWKSAAAAMHLMPVLQDNWPQSQKLIDFVDRWVDFGWWTQPDPESGQSPERAAAGDEHGQSADSGLRRVEMVDDLWSLYSLSNKVTVDWGGL